MANNSESPNEPSPLRQILRGARRYILTGVALTVIVWGAFVAIKQIPEKWDWGLPLALGAVAVFSLTILWKVPRWQVSYLTDIEPKERFDRENEARKTVAQVLAGSVLLAGFYSTWRGITLTQESLSVSQRSLSVSQEGQITDRFTKAIEQLGAVDAGGKKKLEVVLGGIYALERIAEESGRDHWPIMEVLTAYVRDRAPRQWQALEQGSPRESQEPGKSALDVQAVLTVLGRRTTKDEAHQTLDLNKADLREADVHGNFKGVNLMWADLRHADLRGANLSHANLRGANLGGAKLTNVDLSYADLRGENFPEIRSAPFEGFRRTERIARVTYVTGQSFFWADFAGANLLKADFRGADLSGTIGLTQEQIESAMGDASTLLPPGLHAPDGWKASGQ